MVVADIARQLSFALWAWDTEAGMPAQVGINSAVLNPGLIWAGRGEQLCSRRRCDVGFYVIFWRPIVLPQATAIGKRLAPVAQRFGGQP